MRRYLLFQLLLLTTTILLAQKPPIDSLACENWPSIDVISISDNGQFVSYTYNSKNDRKRIIKSIDGKWLKEISYNLQSNNKLVYSPGPSFSFVHDSKKCVFVRAPDTICIIKLNSNETQYITNVRTYRISNRWLAYTSNNNPRNLIILDLIGNDVAEFEDISEFNFTTSGRYMILKKDRKFHDNLRRQISLVNLDSMKERNIWSGNLEPVNITFDMNERHIAFYTADSKDNEIEASLWLYSLNDTIAHKVLSDSESLINMNYRLRDEPPMFSKDGKSIAFELELKGGNSEIDAKIGTSLTLVNSLDRLPSRHSRLKNLWAVISAGSDSIIILSQPSEQILHFESGRFQDYVLVKTDIPALSESNWKPPSKVFLVSVKTGKRTLITDDHASMIEISPDGKHVIYYQPNKRNYINYEIVTGNSKNITERINIPFYDEEEDHPKAPRPYVVNYTWASGASDVILYDRFDVWKFDLSGKKTPICLTNYYGRRNKIIFRLLFERNKFIEHDYGKGDLLLIAFNTVTKQNGFFNLDTSKRTNPKLLSMGDYIYSLPRVAPELFFEERTFVPIKAKKVNSFIVRRESANKAPNFFITTDFITFKDLTCMYPEQKYNWVSAQLISWKSEHGAIGEGILYTPEDFDSSKRYPVIFLIYEKSSYALNKYYIPGFSSGAINIPYFVSNGYLVFRPDIYYTPGSTGKSICTSVISAARELSLLPFVDSNRMGITGHSFGGYEVNYFISVNNSFAAAASAAGVSDLISFYTHDPYTSEVHQIRMGTIPWKDPLKYIDGSPLFRVAKINTPLLIMHGSKDTRVPIEQAIEFYTALRREKKHCWFLRYHNGGHELGGADDVIDYTNKLKLFFDFHLKHAPLPVWMIESQH